MNKKQDIVQVILDNDMELSDEQIHTLSITFKFPQSTHLTTFL